MLKLRADDAGVPVEVLRVYCAFLFKIIPFQVVDGLD